MLWDAWGGFVATKDRWRIFLPPKHQVLFSNRRLSEEQQRLGDFFATVSKGEEGTRYLWDAWVRFSNLSNVGGNAAGVMFCNRRLLKAHRRLGNMFFATASKGKPNIPKAVGRKPTPTVDFSGGKGCSLSSAMGEPCGLSNKWSTEGEPKLLISSWSHEQAKAWKLGHRKPLACPLAPCPEVGGRSQMVAVAVL